MPGSPYRTTARIGGSPPEKESDVYCCGKPRDAPRPSRDAAGVTFVQISLRGVIVFVAALVIVRFGDRRFLSQKTAFDAVLGFILASMLARAVNGTAAFFPTLGGGLVLVVLHRLLGACPSNRS